MTTQTNEPAGMGKLRPIQEHEILTMLAWRNAPEVRKNMYTQHVISEEEHRSWWDRMQSDEQLCYRMFEWNGQASGIVGFSEINRVPDTAMWAFYASPDAAKGVGSKMEIAALDFAFDKLKLKKLKCEVLAFNKPVVRMHQKFGFGIDQIEEDGYKQENDAIDIVHLSITDEVWRQNRQAMIDKVYAR